MKKYLYTQGLAPLAILGIVVLVAVVAGGAYFATQSSNRIAIEEEGIKQHASNKQGSDSLRNLFALGEDLTCTFAYSDGTVENSGTIYMTNGGEQIRGDFVVALGVGEQEESHFIRKGDMSYFWSSQLAQGYAMQIQEDNDFLGVNEEQTNESVDFDSNVEYTCDPWDVDNGIFGLPSNIEFIEFGDVLPSLSTSGGEGAPAVDCSVCDQAPAGSAQDQCRVALGCN